MPHRAHSVQASLPFAFRYETGYEMEKEEIVERLIGINGGRPL